MSSVSHSRKDFLARAPLYCPTSGGPPPPSYISHLWEMCPKLTMGEKWKSNHINGAYFCWKDIVSYKRLLPCIYESPLLITF